LGGDPGVGKSTLLMQVADAVARETGTVLYVSGEESLPQTGLRARRLGLDAAELHVLAETEVGRVIAEVEALKPVLVVVDSIQSVYHAELPAPPGSVGQLRECTQALLRLAKNDGVAVFLVGHVTKEGTIAGPKLLEHMVDTVLYLEGERFHPYRLLRAVKNRFGSTNEVGVFEMRGDGLVEVVDPSRAFLEERPDETSGSVVVVAMEGTRPLLLEVQALVSRTALAVPRRLATGVDLNRLLLVSAVLSKRLGLPLHDYDVHVNVVGGVRIDEPAIDLGVALAVASSFSDRPFDPHAVAIGEIGLAGELRGASQLERRLREAAKLGFSKAVVPRGRTVDALAGVDLEVVAVGSVREAVAVTLGGSPTRTS
ncbi:MAG TPA: DNA repair protein RadA, partial [Chloroflexota bacterium]